MNMLAAVSDPVGRRVELTAERWEHIVCPVGGAGHPELEPYLSEILRAVAQPDHRLAGRRENEEWFLVARTGPSRYLQVVVAFAEDRGWIVTAFARRSLPRGP